ncbi:MAG: FtsX-like permease family protein [Porticoccaceae bacterium]
MRSFSLALQLLRRDWRCGELATLLFSLLIAVSAVLAINLVTERLSAGMGVESAELLGGDLVVRSNGQPDPAWRTKADELGIASAQIHRFDSVIFYGDEMLLVSVKAVSDDYPLLGQLEVKSRTDEPPQAVDRIPAPGSAWVDARVLERLGAEIGDTLEFGATHLQITHILTFEPDQGSGLFQFSPRMLVNEADLAAAEVVGPGSRIRYRSLFAGGDIAGFQAWLEPRLAADQRLAQPGTGENRASATLRKATQYIRIATLLTIVLAAIAIALAARRYSERQFDTSAMLRCLGAPRRRVLRLYIYQLLILTGVAIMAASVLGWAAHWLIARALAPILPLQLPAAGWSPWLASWGSALLLVAGFALPPVLHLGATTPLRVLRRDLTPQPLSAWLVYGLAAGSQSLLLFLLFDDLTEMLLVLLGAGLALLLVGGGIQAALKRLKALVRPSSLLSRSIRNLALHAAISTSQIMAFTITLMLLILVTQLRTGLLDEWRLQLPGDAPNHFAFNIYPEQVEELSAALQERARTRPFYPVVRGRMLAINGDAEAVARAGDNRREHNLTWTDDLAGDNEILQGTWPPRYGEVSVEAEYAERLGLSLGDTLSFNVGGTRFDATVSSLRSVVWESFSPNFFLIFSGEQLADMPATYLTSFYLPAGNGDLLRQLAGEFPAMTLIDVDAILERMQLILSQVSITVELVMLFILLGGFAVLFSTLQSTAETRRQEGALMRALGASRGYLRNACLMEFGLIGLIAGALAITGAEIATAILYIQVFEMRFTPSPLLWIAVPLLSSVVVATVGYAASRGILDVSPVEVLNG